MSENESPATATPTPTVSDDMLVILPVRNIVLFPGTVLPIGMNREASIAAAQEVVRAERKLGVLLQRDSDQDEVTGEDLHRIGTVASVLRYVTGQDGAHHLVLQGERAVSRARFPAGAALPHGTCRIPAGENAVFQRDRSAGTQPQAPRRRGHRAAAARPCGARECGAEHRIAGSTRGSGCEFPGCEGLGESAAARDSRPQGTPRPGVGAGLPPHRGDEAAAADRRTDAWCHR